MSGNLVTTIVCGIKRTRNPGPRDDVPILPILPRKQRIISLTGRDINNNGVYYVEPDNIKITSVANLRQHADYECMCQEVCICRSPSCQLCGSYISDTNSQQLRIWGTTYSQVCTECRPVCRHARLDMLSVRIVTKMFGKMANVLVRRHIDTYLIAHTTLKMPKVLIHLILMYFNGEYS